MDLQLIPLALTGEQCQAYNLPRTPIKDTERRKDKFEETFGIGATELDALEALHPGEMARLVEAEIDNFLDPTLGSRVGRARNAQQRVLAKIEARVMADYADQIDGLIAEMDEVTGRVEELWAEIAAALEEDAPDLSGVKIPRSKAPGETDSLILFDSKRDYLTQMDAYNDWRDGCEGNAP